MNELDKILTRLKDDINDIPCVKEYIFLKDAIKNNKELIKLEKDIKEATENGNFKLLNELKIKYDSHPLINNFKIIKKETLATLLEIKEQLERK